MPILFILSSSHYKDLRNFSIIKERSVELEIPASLCNKASIFGQIKCSLEDNGVVPVAFAVGGFSKTCKI